MEGLISAGLNLVNNTVDILFGSRRRREYKLPDWLSPREFQQQDNTPVYLVFGLLILIIIVVIVIARKR